MRKEQEESVVCIYNESSVSIEQKIVEVFEQYVLANIQNMDS